MSADDIMPSAAQVEAAEEGRATHPREPHSGGTAGRLNWLRAAVLGANDGIVSVAGIVIGVAGATTNRGPIFTAGLAGLVAGAVSMALGEYVSVSSQRDSERAQIKQEKRELAASPEAELTELTALYEAKGLSAATVLQDLTAQRQALAALGVPDDHLARKGAGQEGPASQRETCPGSRVACTTPVRSARTASTSTASWSRAANAATVTSAS